jgi:GTP cyclohydrolase II
MSAAAQRRGGRRAPAVAGERRPVASDASAIGANGRVSPLPDLARLERLKGLEALVERDLTHDCEGVGAPKVCVRVMGVAQLPSRLGSFEIVAFWNNRDAKEHVAMIHGDVLGREDVPTRIHSECLTGDVMGSLRCDCRDQLEYALRDIGRMDRGILLYLRQEGRGIGLINKIRAYALQDEGLDTVEANQALGFGDDERDYAIAAHMLQSLTVKSVRLITNNPDKIEQLTRYGVPVSGRIPHIIPPNAHNRFYLETKAKRSGHYIDFEGKPHLREQGDPVLVAGMPDDDDG